MAEAIRIRGLSKVFPAAGGSEKPTPAVRNIDLTVEEGRLVTLLGPSGCGKSTLLRMIAGFEEPTEGDIWLGGRRINDLPPNARDTAMVFQSYAIFPHLDVFENVAFGLRLKRLAAGEIARRVGRVLDMTGLTALATRSPGQLSGGQQQRVALARCIVMEPRLLLFDEPLSNLDAKLREQMRGEIRDLQQRLRITALYVTHDQTEAMSISDEVVVMNAGTIEQIGTPRGIYVRPVNRFVAGFVGRANFIPARVVAARRVEVLGVGLDLDRDAAQGIGSSATLVLRPEAIRMSAEGGTFRGTVKRAVFLGNFAEYQVEVPGADDLLVDSPNPGESHFFEVGASVFLSPSPGSLHVFA
jgi:iron(III) transport system ATP-binding protein